MAQAPPPPDPAQLEYARVDLCPEESFFRDFVAARLGGHDPFTADATRRIALTLRRKKTGAYVAKVEMYTQAGTLLGGDDLAEINCVSLVENAGRVVVSWLVPLVGPTPVPVEEPRQVHSPAPRPLAPKPRHAVEHRPPAIPVPLLAPKPGVFDGKLGVARAFLFGVGAGGLASGITLEEVAVRRGDQARELLGMLQQKAGPAPCVGTAAFAATCQQIVELRQQHDNFAMLAAGSLVVGGVTAAAASIWSLRTLGAPSVQVRASAPGSLAGLTLQGSW